MKALPLAIALLALSGNMEASNGGICQSCILRQQSHKDDLSQVKYYEDTEFNSRITKYTFDDENDADKNDENKQELAENTQLPPPAPQLPRQRTVQQQTTTTTTTQPPSSLKEQLQQSVHNKYGTDKSKTSNRTANTSPTTGTSSSSSTRNWGSVTGNPR